MQSLSKASKQFRRRGERTQALAGFTQRVHPRCGQKGVWRRHASREECASRYGLRSRNVSAMHALLNPQGSTNRSQFGVQTTGTTSLHRLLAQSDGEAGAARADGQHVDGRSSRAFNFGRGAYGFACRGRADDQVTPAACMRATCEETCRSPTL